MMIEGRQPQVPATIPPYFGMKPADNEIIGAGHESSLVIDSSLQIITYGRALDSGFLSITGAPACRSSIPYSDLKWQLAALRNAPEDDDLGRIRPSDAAIEAASDVAFRMMKSAAGMPSPVEVSTDRDGAVRVLWENDNRALELVCPFEPGQRPYLYYSEGDRYSIAYDLSADRLGYLVAWMAGSIDAFPQ